MADDLENVYARLWAIYSRRRRYGLYAAVCVLVIYGLATSAPLITLAGLQNNSSVTAALGLVLLVSFILLPIFLIKSRIRYTRQQVTTIRIYKAYVKTKDLINHRSDERFQKDAKRALSGILFDINLWKGRKTPRFMLKPVTDLEKVIRDKAFVAITRGDEKAIEKVKQFLYDLLVELHNDPVEVKLQPIINNLDSLSIQQPPIEERTELKLLFKNILNKLQAINQKKVWYSILIFLPFLIGGLVVILVIPIVDADSKERLSVDARFNAFVEIILGGVAAVITYLVIATRKETFRFRAA
jgi:hypothetical protein